VADDEEEEEEEEEEEVVVVVAVVLGALVVEEVVDALVMVAAGSQPLHHWLCALQAWPSMQQVDPVQPCPPHCAQATAQLPSAGALVVEEVVGALVVVPPVGAVTPVPHSATAASVTVKMQPWGPAAGWLAQPKTEPGCASSMP